VFSESSSTRITNICEKALERIVETITRSHKDAAFCEFCLGHTTEKIEDTNKTNQREFLWKVEMPPNVTITLSNAESIDDLSKYDYIIDITVRLKDKLESSQHHWFVSVST